MASDKTKKETKVEVAKKQSRHLRGTIAETLTDQNADCFGHDDLQLLKFHGTYQQDDRDVRKQRRAEGKGPAYSFMIRTAIPAGALSADQYLALDALADQHANGSLRATTRQGFQFHGVIKSNLKSTIAGINKTLLTTLSACGDVERNVMACPAPLADEAHRTLREVARNIAVELRPASAAYHEIWLNGEKHVTSKNGGNEEPFYGENYLPRKFKSGLALHNDNCIDVYSMDVGLIAIVNGGRLEGFNVVGGGGMGMTHNKEETFAAMAQPLGYIDPPHAVQTARTIASIFRDYGDRTDRKHARLKYLLADWGIERFTDELRKRASFTLHEFKALPRIPSHDHLGKHPQGQDQWFYGVFIPNGRVVDTDDVPLKSLLRRIVSQFNPGLRLTPHQNILFTDLAEKDADQIEKMIRDHGIAPANELSAARRFSMACPALPTCGLALSESERLMPSVVDELETELTALDLRDAPITIRMTGCPNGCARPYSADIAFVGKGPDNYQIFVGGALEGDRMVDLYAADVAPPEFVTTLRPLLHAWAAQRKPDEGFGDFYQRIMNHSQDRRTVTGKESPTQELVQLRINS